MFQLPVLISYWESLDAVNDDQVLRPYSQQKKKYLVSCVCK